MKDKTISIYRYKTNASKLVLVYIRFILKLKSVLLLWFLPSPVQYPRLFISLLLLDKTTVVSCEFIVLSSSVHYHGLHLQCPECACIFIVECRQKISIMLKQLPEHWRPYINLSVRLSVSSTCIGHPGTNTQLHHNYFWNIREMYLKWIEMTNISIFDSIIFYISSIMDEKEKFLKAA